MDALIAAALPGMARFALLVIGAIYDNIGQGQDFFDLSRSFELAKPKLVSEQTPPALRIWLELIAVAGLESMGVTRSFEHGVVFQ